MKKKSKDELFLKVNIVIVYRLSVEVMTVEGSLGDF